MQTNTKALHQVMYTFDLQWKLAFNTAPQRRSFYLTMLLSRAESFSFSAEKRSILGRKPTVSRQKSSSHSAELQNRTHHYPSERHTHRKVEGEIARQHRMGNREMLAGGFVCRIDSLHSHIETQYEIIEIETYAQPIAHG